MEYGHGGDIYAPSLKEKALLDFSVNLNPLGIPPKVKAVFGTLAEECEAYPDPFCRELKHALAKHEGIAEECILFGNGAADLIYRIAYGLRPKKVLLPAPTFSEYEAAAVQVGAEIAYHPLLEEDGFSLDKRFLDALRQHQPDMVFLCNPNNPTGRLIPKGLLMQIADYCQAHGAFLIVDECFLDMAAGGEACSMKTELSRYPQLLVLKAFTKFFAMAGLRLGYLFSGAETVRTRVESAGQPWSVSVPAQKCGLAALTDTAYIMETKRLLPELGKALYEQLSELPVKVYPSAANYFLLKTDRADLKERLLEKGILIRSCSNYRGLREGYFRVAVKSAEDNGQLMAALREIDFKERR